MRRGPRVLHSTYNFGVISRKDHHILGVIQLSCRRTSLLKSKKMSIPSFVRAYSHIVNREQFPQNHLPRCPVLSLLLLSNVDRDHESEEDDLVPIAELLQIITRLDVPTAGSRRSPFTLKQFDFGLDTHSGHDLDHPHLVGIGVGICVF